MDKDSLYWDLRQENDAWLKRQWWWWRHHLNGTLKSERERERLRQAAEAEDQVAEYIRQELGYQAHLTTANCPFDLYVTAGEDSQACRVEVKLSTYARNGQGGRYQCNIRAGQEFDILVFVARNGQDWHYVIPVEALKQRRNIAIWSLCPGDYRGQWRSYLNAWHYLDQILTNSQTRVWQLNLPTKELTND